jgi:arginine/lysine/ornithine decarboxylase
MTAIDKLVKALTDNKAQSHLQMIEKLGNRLKAFIENSKDFTLYKSDKDNISTDILIKHKFLDAPTLQNLLMNKGIFSEAVLGQGLLFFLGIGSQESDINKLEAALEKIMADHPSKPLSQSSATESITYQLANTKPISQPKAIDQVISPRKAFFMPSHIVSAKEAVRQISAECLAPCPPGWTILVPGQRITEEILEFKNIKSVRIVKTNGKFGNV